MTLFNYETVTRYTRSGSADAAGGVDYADASIGAVLECTRQPLSTRERIEQMQYGYEVDWKLFFTEDPGSNHEDVFVDADGTRLYQRGKTMHRTGLSTEYWLVFAEEPEHRQQES